MIIFCEVSDSEKGVTRAKHEECLDSCQNMAVHGASSEEHQKRYCAAPEDFKLWSYRLRPHFLRIHD